MEKVFRGIHLIPQPANSISIDMVMFNATPTRNVRRGFTLLEAALVTCIVGVGVTALLQLMAAGTVSNTAGTELTTGLTLAKNIREMTLGLAFADPKSAHRWDTLNPPHWGRKRTSRASRTTTTWTI